MILQYEKNFQESQISYNVQVYKYLRLQKLLPYTCVIILDNASLNSLNELNLGPTLEMLGSRLGDVHKFSVLFLLFFS